MQELRLRTDAGKIASADREIRLQFALEPGKGGDAVQRQSPLTHGRLVQATKEPLVQTVSQLKIQNAGVEIGELKDSENVRGLGHG
jgi:hypothetical protein